MSALDRVVQLVENLTGVEVSRGGIRTSLERYVDARIARGNLESVESFLRSIERRDEAEIRALYDVVSVPHTWFFRDEEQMDHVGRVMTALESPRALHVWVPGCATGEDAYTLAMLCAETGVTATITGSDLCPTSLVRAKEGRYSQGGAMGLAARCRPWVDLSGDEFVVRPEVRQGVSFVHHNLLEEPLSAPGGWDIILCRNVLIYFSEQTAHDCARRLATALHPDGHVFFGSGEMIHCRPAGLVPVVSQRRFSFQWRPREGGARATPTPLAPKVSPCVPSTTSADEERTTNPSWRASAADPLDAELRARSGLELFTAGNYEKALHQLRAAQLLDDSLWHAAVYHGLCLEKLGQSQQALVEFRHAVRLLDESPNSQDLNAPFDEVAGHLAELARERIR